MQQTNFGEDYSDITVNKKISGLPCSVFGSLVEIVSNNIRKRLHRDEMTRGVIRGNQTNLGFSEEENVRPVAVEEVDRTDIIIKPADVRLIDKKFSGL